MDSAKSLVLGVVGGFFSVAIIYLITNKNSNATGLIKESFSGFANTLGVAMGNKSSY
jgi:hypothetical protein